MGLQRAGAPWCAIQFRCRSSDLNSVTIMSRGQRTTRGLSSQPSPRLALRHSIFSVPWPNRETELRADAVRVRDQRPEPLLTLASFWVQIRRLSAEHLVFRSPIKSTWTKDCSRRRNRWCPANRLFKRTRCPFRPSQSGAWVRAKTACPPAQNAAAPFGPQQKAISPPRTRCALRARIGEEN